MKTEKLPVIARRDLFRGAATLLGGAALGLGPGLAFGQTLKSGGVSSPSLPTAPVAPAQPISIGFWDGKHFVSADTLPSGDVTLDRIRLTITSGNGGGFNAIEANGLVPTGRAIQKVPFTLWNSRPTGAKKNRAVVPTSVGEGLTLNAIVGSAKQVIGLRNDSVAGPKLREGSYVLAPGKMDWTTLSLDPSGQLLIGGVGGRPMSSPYLLVSVERN